MGTIKDKNGIYIIDAEEIKKRLKEDIEELYKKDTNEMDYYNGVVSHPEPDILESKVKWALRSIAVNKASGCDEIPEELYRKDLHEPDYYYVVVSHSEPDILWCEVKWALRSTAVNKASGCSEIAKELNYSNPQRRMPSRSCIHYVSESGRPSRSHKTGKGSILIPILKNVLTIRQLHSSHMLVRSCLKS